MSKAFHTVCVALVCLAQSSVMSEEATQKNSTVTSPAAKAKPAFQSFTGKILGANVRLRLDADVESPIIKELEKGQMIVVVDEKNDYYAIEPLKDIKAYISRNFVLDNTVEGTRVNIRLAPDMDAPVITHLNKGDRVEGIPSTQNPKWMEINPPSGTRFYIAKEFVEYLGPADMKEKRDRKIETASQLMEKAQLQAQSELRKPFEEMDYDRLVSSYQAIMADYQDLPEFIEQAKSKLSTIQETYLQKKLAYLESKAVFMDKASHYATAHHVANDTESPQEKMTPSERMKIWEPIERSLYLTWTEMNHAKSMKDFYEDQKVTASVISGVLESYVEPVKNRPGEYILRERGLPVAYVYSTQVNLHQFIGKQVSVVASPRTNNNFAFPAYYVIEVQ